MIQERLHPINEHVVNGAAIGHTVGRRHKYKEIVISDDAKVHNGNIGIGKSEGHDFQRIEARGGRKAISYPHYAQVGWFNRTRSIT